jgi:uncharacterized membrane protein SirB2
VYPALKYLHVAAAAASISLFLVRGFWMMTDSPRLQSRFARLVPHVVDTLLLASAIGLVLTIGQYPFAAPWLTAKVLAVLVYIVLGSIALKRGRTRRIRVAAFIAAVAVFGWIVQTARLHHVWLPAG